MNPTRPNVLVMFCDQLRIDLLRCYGGDRVRTPNLDALAADGLLFEQAYTPTAICSPARASLMTGMYAHEHHMFNNSTPSYSYCLHLRPDAHMIQDWADENTDYQTGYFGKWHIGPAEDLFNSRFHCTHPRPYEGGPGYLANSHWHPHTSLGPLRKAAANPRLGPGQTSGLVDVPYEDFPDVAAARYCREFIDKRDPNRPFLAFCAFPGPHSPWLVPESFGLRYRPEDIDLWENRRDPMRNKPLNQRKLRELTRQQLRQENCTEEEYDDNLRRALAACFSYLELIDQCVGELVAYLKEKNLYDRTAIVFTADHGDMAGSHGIKSKGACMYDEIYRIPMMLKMPGNTTSKRIQEPVHLMDVTATCMELMSGEAPTDMLGQPLHGRSLCTFATDSPEWPRPVHYAQYHGDWYGHYSSRMVTDGRWKLVWNFNDLGELYDLASDPQELRNRFYDPDCRELRGRYFERLLEAARESKDAQALQWARGMGDPGAFEDAVGANLAEPGS